MLFETRQILLAKYFTYTKIDFALRKTYVHDKYWRYKQHLYCAVRVLWCQTDQIPNRRVVGTDRNAIS